jgi:hypothetical protein
VRRILVAVVCMAALGAMARPAQAPPIEGGNFSTHCDYSHSSNDDPIVYPRIEGGSMHRHDFFGNITTSYRSRYSNMHVGEAAYTTCANTLDTAAYWQPSIKNGAGNFLAPTQVIAYYRVPGQVDPADVQAWVPNSKIVSGDPAVPLNLNRIWWTCAPSQLDGKHADPNFACAQGHLTAHINFPPCWDGVMPADGTNDSSHYAWTSQGQCVAPFSTPVPDLGITVHWNNVTDCTGAGIGPCSVDMGAYLHADFFQAWDQSELERLVEECLNIDYNCGDI